MKTNGLNWATIASELKISRRKWRIAFVIALIVWLLTLCALIVYIAH